MLVGQRSCMDGRTETRAYHQKQI
ncbi:hypothetical protein M3J09_012293 [Ascochyta lentis]